MELCRTRICLFAILVDQSDVGPNIIEAILMNYLLVVYGEVEKKSTETLKPFQTLLDTLEPYFIWEYLTKHFEMVFNQTSTYALEHICGIILMLLDISALDSDAEMKSEHLPTMLCHLIEIIDHRLDQLSPTQISSCLDVLLHIFEKLLPKTKTAPLSSGRRSLENPLDRSEKSPATVLIDHELSTNMCVTLVRTGQVDVSSASTDSSSRNEIEHLLDEMVHQVEEQRRETPVLINTVPLSTDLIDRAIQLYQRLFHQFVVQHLVHPTDIDINDRFQRISSILRSQTTGSLSSIRSHYQQYEEFQLKLNDHADDYLSPFEDCCELLRQCLSCPPRSSSNSTDFNDWLKDLCVLALCRTESFTLQTTFVSFLIELFDSTLKSPSYESILSLVNESDFFQYLIADLWSYLSDHYDREHHVKAARLLSLLHSVLPSDLCDELICHQLALVSSEHHQSRVTITDQYQRFFKLWHYTRDEPLAIPPDRSPKPFQRCLLSLLTILHDSKHYSLKSAVQQWTHDCFAHGKTPLRVQRSFH